MNQKLDEIHNKVWVLSQPYFTSKDCKDLINILYKTKGFKLLPVGVHEKITDLCKLKVKVVENHPNVYTLDDLYDGIKQLKDEDEATYLIDQIKKHL